MSRTWSRSRPDELGAEWELDDVEKGYTATVAVDINRERFLWSAVWSPPKAYTVSWIEDTPEGPLLHEAIPRMKEIGHAWTLEDAKEEAEEAIEALRVKVRELKLEDRMAAPVARTKKAARR